MIIAKITDFGTILIVLLFLTKEQVGAASLVVAFGGRHRSVRRPGHGHGARAGRRRCRASNLTHCSGHPRCGVRSGRPDPARRSVHRLPYGIAGVGAYFLAIAVKQPLVGAAVIPLAMMNRELQYERIAIVNVGTTFAAALTRLGLAIVGAGAWAIVIAYTASGFFTLIGVALVSPFRPRLKISWSAISPLLKFGTRATLSGLCEQMINNVHHLLVGWFYGRGSACGVSRGF